MVQLKQLKKRNKTKNSKKKESAYGTNICDELCEMITTKKKTQITNCNVVCVRNVGVKIRNEKSFQKVKKNNTRRKKN